MCCFLFLVVLQPFRVASWTPRGLPGPFAQAKKPPMLISQPHTNGRRRQRAYCSQLHTRSMSGSMAGCMDAVPAGRLGEGGRAASAQCIEASCDLCDAPKTMSHPAWISSASAGSPSELLNQHDRFTKPVAENAAAAAPPPPPPPPLPPRGPAQPLGPTERVGIAM